MLDCEREEVLETDDVDDKVSVEADDPVCDIEGVKV